MSGANDQTVPAAGTGSRSLGHARRGYEYQDLLGALLLAELLHDRAGTLLIDRKAIAGDRFDDFTRHRSGQKTKVQVKHSSADARSLKQEDFTTDSTGLRIDALVRTHLGCGTECDEYRLWTNWTVPDLSSVAWLIPIDPGRPLLSSAVGRTYRLNVDHLWPAGGVPAWNILAAERMARQDFADFCAKFVIELECPEFSEDLRAPGKLEGTLLVFLGDRLGIGHYPNADQSPHDIGERLVSFARTRRDSPGETRLRDVENWLQLRTDFGTVPQDPSVDPERLVKRADQLEGIADTVLSAGVTIVEGPPGSGKTWLLEETAKHLREARHLVARHYCFLEPGDELVSRRISTDVLWGNLVYELIQGAPSLRDDVHRTYAAGRWELERLLPGAVERSPTGHVVLLIDGLDHIDRVRQTSGAVTVEESRIIDELATLNIPEGVHIVFGTQPGAHLAPLGRLKPSLTSVPPWAAEDIVVLAERAGLRAALENAGLKADETLAVLSDRAAGNPLYATYLTRSLDAQLQAGRAVDPVSFLDGAPSIDGNVSAYYRHLLPSVEGPQQYVARVLSSADFALSKADLRSILPDFAYDLDNALEALAPVLSQDGGTGGIRVYHESFRRFILEGLAQQGVDMAAVLEPLRRWLDSLGFLEDPRAFRFLLPTLRRSHRFDDLLSRIDPTLVSRSVAEGHSEESIERNLYTALAVAAQVQDWAGLLASCHLLASLRTCFGEKLVPRQYGRVLALVKGADALASALVFEGRPTMSREVGLELCSVCDDAGGAPPWRLYLPLPASREKEVGHERSTELILAEFHGRARVKGIAWAVRRLAKRLNGDPDFPRGFLRKLVDLLAKLGGKGALGELRTSLTTSSDVESLVDIALAREWLRLGDSEAAQAVAQAACEQPVSAGMAVELIALGARPSADWLDAFPLDEFDPTTAPGRYNQDNEVGEWINRVQLHAHLNPSDLDALRTRMAGEGWYRLWLQFVIDTALIEAGSLDSIAEAFEQLASDTRPFVGEPRACDLYQHRSLAASSVRRALELISTDDDWSRSLTALRAVIKGTTTGLERSRTGPLTTDVLTEILLALSASQQRPEVFEFIRTEYEASTTQSHLFDTHAEHELHYAEALAIAGRPDEALEHWDRASVFLCSYGFRKDMLLFDLVHGLPALGESDPDYARSCTERVQPLVNTVVAHTDGKETRHLPGTWFETLLAVDPCGALCLLGDSLVQWGGRHGWIMEEALADAVAHLSNQGDPLVRRDLLLSIPYGGGKESRAAMLDTLQEVVTEQDEADVHVRLFAAKFEGDPVDDDPKWQGLIEPICRNHGIPLPVSSLPPKPSKSDGGDNDSASRSRDDELGSISMFATDASPLDILAWIRRLDGRLLEKGENADLFVQMFVPRLASLDADDLFADALSLVRALAHEVGIFRSGEILATLAQEFDRLGRTRLAAVTFVLAYTRARGNWGWGCFGDKDQLHLLAEGLRADRQLAIDMLAAESAELGRSYPYGLGQHLVEALVAIGLRDDAKSAWEALFGVLQHRLEEPDGAPSRGVLTRYQPGAVFTNVLDEALGYALLARTAHPELTRKTEALAGICELLARNPQSLVPGMSRLIRRDSTDANLALLLQAVYEHEPAPYDLSAGLADPLGLLVGTDHFSLDYLARALLQRRGLHAAPFPAMIKVKPRDEGLGAQRVRAIRWLDHQGRLERIERVVPNFGDVVAADFDATWHESGLQRRSQERHEVARSGVRRLPEPPMLHWETELFETVINRQGMYLPGDFKAAGQWSPDSAGPLFDLLKPDTESAVHLRRCRGLRPDYPMPSEIEDGLDECKREADNAPRGGWVRIAKAETQVLFGDEMLPHAMGEVTVYSGIVSVKGDAIPSGALPYASSPLKVWKHQPRFDGVVQLIHGPLIVMEQRADILGERTIFGLDPEHVSRLGLTLHGQRPYCFVDANGEVAVELRVWHVRPCGDRFDEESPTLYGCDLIARPDVFDRLHAMTRFPIRVMTVRDTIEAPPIPSKKSSGKAAVKMVEEHVELPQDSEVDQT